MSFDPIWYTFDCLITKIHEYGLGISSKQEGTLFEVPEAYEVMMGRWSRQLAPLFVEFVGVRDGESVLDVGCGTGSLSATLARVTGLSKIVGIDPSNGFVDYARTQITDPRVTFEVGDAQNLRYPDSSFNRCMALLVVDYIPDAPKAAIEMRRVTRTAGVVATTMWDRSCANELYACFWDAAEAIDPTAKRPAGKRGSYGSAEALSGLWTGAGLTDIEVADLMISCQFSSFDELWQRYLTGEGPPGAYMAGLSTDRRDALRRTMQQDVLGDGPDRAFALQAKAWAVRGSKP
jgi:ubiquinone/menaquinone biosynthesis C-methylase UbiE